MFLDVQDSQVPEANTYVTLPGVFGNLLSIQFHLNDVEFHLKFLGSDSATGPSNLHPCTYTY